MRWLSSHNRETFYRTLATIAVVILGGLAYYGLHRDIEATSNPCVQDTKSFECAKYACGIGQYLPIRPSDRCLLVLGHVKKEENR